jgi:hypothetical protein
VHQSIDKAIHGLVSKSSTVRGEGYADGCERLVVSSVPGTQAQGPNEAGSGEDDS